MMMPKTGTSMRAHTEASSSAHEAGDAGRYEAPEGHAGEQRSHHQGSHHTCTNDARVFDFVSSVSMASLVRLSVESLWSRTMKAWPMSTVQSDLCQIMEIDKATSCMT